MKKLILPLVLISIIISFTACETNDGPISEVGPGFILDIETTVPRVSVENGNMVVFLSVTNEAGEVLEGVTKANISNISYTFNGVTTVVDQPDFELRSGGSGVAYDVGASLCLDYSGSMDRLTDIPAMELAVGDFIQLKNQFDWANIIKFSSTVLDACPFTTLSNDLIYAIDSINIASGSTAFFGALELGLNNVDTLMIVSQSRAMLPAVIGFTDGVNNVAPLSPATAIAFAIQNQYPIYTIGFGDLSSNYPDTAMLRHIADTTGGRYYFAPTTYDILELYQYVSGQLGGMYVITFPFGGAKTNDPGTLNITIDYMIGTKTFSSKITKTFYI